MRCLQGIQDHTLQLQMTRLEYQQTPEGATQRLQWLPAAIYRNEAVLCLWVHFLKQFPQQVRYRFAAKWKVFSRNKQTGPSGAADWCFWIINLCLTCLGPAEGRHRPWTDDLFLTRQLYTSCSLALPLGGGHTVARYFELPVSCRFFLALKVHYQGPTLMTV